MDINALETRLNKDRVLLDPQDRDDLKLLREEVQDFARAMEAGKGRERDNPHMYCTALIDDPKKAIDAAQFPDAAATVVSVGGTNVHYRALEIEDGRISESTGLTGGKARSGNIVPRIPTPCHDGGHYTLEEMLQPIAQGLVPWLDMFLSRNKLPHILLNWGFCQKSVPVPESQGITGAIGQQMSKGQSNVAADGRELHATLRNVLLQCGKGMEEDISRLGITVQNDTVMAMFRYLEKWRRQKYRKFALMINGTGSNMCSAEPYLFEDDDSVVTDAQGYPVRLSLGKRPGAGQHMKRVWVNYESGHMFLTRSQVGVDRLRPGEEELVDDIENFGLAGTGFYRIFANLVEDYVPDGPGQIAKMESLADKAKMPLGAEFIIQLAGLHSAKSALDITSVLGQGGIADEALEAFQFLAGVVVTRSALRLAEVLAASSLFTGLGVQDDEKQDALAMEGSIWKAQRYSDQVFEFWSQLLKPELKAVGRREVNIDFIVEDDYNAGVLGPAYLLGQYVKPSASGVRAKS